VNQTRRSFHTLLAANSLVQIGDQLALSALPLAAVLLLDATPREVGILAAVYSIAWLVIALPAGVLADRMGHRSLILAAAGLLAAFAGATARTMPLVAVASFAAACGSVAFTLGQNAMLPTIVAATDLPRSNARIELARGVIVLAAPLLAGILAERGFVAIAFLLASLGPIAALPMLLTLASGGASQANTAARTPILTAILEGAAFVRREPHLRAIATCAVFWNFAYFALMAIFVPYALGELSMSAAEAGFAQSAFGAASMVAAMSAGAIFHHLAPRIVLVAGPAASILAAALLLVAEHGSGLVPSAACFALLGFTPMLWFICQTSLRQSVTPPELLGRATATIQVTIYGVRPLGALAGGAIAESCGFTATLVLVAAAYAISCVVVCLSPLARLKRMPGRAAAAR
jgi:MFS family permease